MSFEAKKEHSIAIMESKKMWRCNYAPPLATPRMESWIQDTTATFCLILANNLADGGMVWSGMGDLYVVFYLEGRRDATGRSICLKHSRRYLLWCSYGCVSLVAKGS